MPPCVVSRLRAAWRGHVSVPLDDGRAHHLSAHRAGGRAKRGLRVAVLRAAARRTVITPLLFSHAGTKERDTLKPTGIAPERLYPTATLYQALAEAGIPSYIIQHGEHTPSTYSDVVFAGATALGYRTLPEALVNLRLLLARQRRPTYYVLYFDRLDALCHEYGPNSPQVDAELDAFLTTLERQLLAPLDAGRGDTLVLLTADRGQSETHPLRTVYLIWRAVWRGGRSSIAAPT